MKDIVFINSHPIQYFAPMYKYMNEQGMRTKAWYCSDESIKGGFDTEFGVDVKWDIPLLEGYEYHFFKNNSWKPSHANGFFGLLNLSMVKELLKAPASVVIVHGWHYCTLLLILLLGKIKGHTVCLRNDMPQSHELLKKGWKQVVKRIGLKYLLFPRIDYFLYIGSQNRLFYKSYGLADQRLLSCPYAVDNARFRQDSLALSGRTDAIKAQMGIPAGDKIILYSAKYIEKKRPLDLLRAFIQLNQPNCWLLMVGEGELRPEMEKLIAEHQLTNVILTGFVNQSRISEYYAISDIFVMCSSVGENWGLSVNEAMNFDLPVILSNLTGCADDLVHEGINGYVFETSNVEELTARLRQALVENTLPKTGSSTRIIDEYSYATVVANLKTILN